MLSVHGLGVYVESGDFEEVMPHKIYKLGGLLNTGLIRRLSTVFLSRMAWIRQIRHITIHFMHGC